MSRTVLGLLLLVMWVLLWGDLSLANVLSGVVVIVLLFVVFPSDRPLTPRSVLRPWPFLQLVAYFLRQVIVSNLLLARQIAGPRARLVAQIVDVPMRTSSPGFLTLITNITALTPGAIAVTVQDRPARIAVHALVLREVDEVSRNLWRLEELCVRAFGTAEAVREVEAVIPDVASCTHREVPPEVLGPRRPFEGPR